MTTTNRTSKGRPVTGEQIEALASQAEAGYDQRLRGTGGRKPMGSAAARVVPVRLDPDLDQAVRARALADHATTSDVIRHALRAYLDGPAA